MNRDCSESKREDRIPVTGPAQKKARSLRMMYYAVYVAALLLAEGLIGAVVASSADGEASLLTYTIDAAVMMLPLVILQLTVAALAVKVPSLRWLFVLTVAFGIGAGLLSLAFMHVPEGWQRWLRWLPFGGPLWVGHYFI